jgi:hypothetical protein
LDSTPMSTRRGHLRRPPAPAPPPPPTPRQALERQQEKGRRLGQEAAQLGAAKRRLRAQLAALESQVAEVQWVAGGGKEAVLGLLDEQNGGLPELLEALEELSAPRPLAPAAGGAASAEPGTDGVAAAAAAATGHAEGEAVAQVSSRASAVGWELVSRMRGALGSPWAGAVACCALPTPSTTMWAKAGRCTSLMWPSGEPQNAAQRSRLVGSPLGNCFWSSWVGMLWRKSC